jgi:Lrp/AsnC family transcriptional regulator of ectoine degradation
MIKLDKRDIQILSILQREGRITKKALAERVNLSPAPCWERLKRLERAGIIEGYGARISSAVFGPHTTVFMQAELKSHQAQDFDRFEKAIQSMDEILECWAVGGGIDYLIKIVTVTIDDYQRFVDSILKANIGLKRYYTYVVTKHVKSSPTPLVLKHEE